MVFGSDADSAISCVEIGPLARRNADMTNRIISPRKAAWRGGYCLAFTVWRSASGSKMRTAA